MTKYKPHYACFNCRKTFKRKLLWDINEDDKAKEIEAKCPQCDQLMADMGLDFASPKKNDTKQWSHIKDLYSVGITFHSCGCSGPGYIPKDRERLLDYFEEIINRYTEQLVFWRNRIEPSSEKEIQRENSKYWDKISLVPFEQKNKKSPVTNEVAIKHWLYRIKEVEEKIHKINYSKKQS